MPSGPARIAIFVGALALGAAALGPPGALADPKPPSGGATGPSAPAPAQSKSGFTNYSVAEGPGTTCPTADAASDCSNYAAEPAIRADRNGTFYASSENGLAGGTLAVRSQDGGQHYLTLPSPNQLSSSIFLTPGGGDTDLAIAPVANSAGNFNVYVASLSLANVDVSTSTDRGQSWTTNYRAATIPGDDREWIAADGPAKVCLSYHDAYTSNIDVNCSTDAGASFSQLGSAIDVNHLFLVNNNEIGNLTIDPLTHAVYQLFSGIDSHADVVTGAAYHDVWLAVSTDGGKTFTDRLVYRNPNPSVSYGHQFVNLSVDTAGHLYAVYSDDHNLSYSFSTTAGRKWSRPARINKSGTAIMPWSVAGTNGKLDVVWYGTSFAKAGVTPDNYPAKAAWNVYFAQNLSATKPGSSFSVTAASPVNHHGGVCEGGVACAGNRDLFDDFGVAASPTTGMASIIYTDDQYRAGQPNQAGCDAKGSDSTNCNHTAIATQTRFGRPIF